MAMAMAMISVEKSVSKCIGVSRRRELANFPPSSFAAVPAVSISKQGKSSSGRRSFPSLRTGKCMAITSVEESDGSSTTTARPLANFAPSVWGSSFASLSVSSSEVEWYSRKVAELKEEVKEMLALSAKDPLQNIEFIDHLERLGVSYHFEAEIEDQLSLIFDSLPSLDNNNNNNHVVEDYDLYSSALLFRILRQNGYKAPCDLFKKFKGTDGRFKEALKSDVRGILSLYEASHVNLHGEDILEEALAFARASLEEFLLDSSPRQDDDDPPHLVEHIKNALIWPFHRSSRRMETLKYISFYAHEESKKETLLRFAKVDFNYVQLLHQQELATVARWWKEKNLTEEIWYARDRVVELYFWAMGGRFEPNFSATRIASVKFSTFVSMVDDTYDAYGTPSELELFTQAFDRCDMSAIGLLPDYMRILYGGVMKFFNETEVEQEKLGRCYSATHAKEEFKRLVRSYDVQAKWTSEGHIPVLSEYMENGLSSGAFGITTAACFTGLHQFAGIEEHEWLQTSPTIYSAMRLLARLLDDIAGHKEEQERGHCASAVECCMEEKGLTEEEAVMELNKICEDLWKDVNEEAMRPTAVGMPVIRFFVDMVRINGFIYRFKDTYTNPVYLEDHIKRFLLDPLPL